MNNCKYCKADCALRGEENLKECKGYIPMTNSDRIHSMTDEELAAFLCEGKICTFCFCDDFCAIGGIKGNGILKWLQQPVEKQKEDT